MAESRLAGILADLCQRGAFHPVDLIFAMSDIAARLTAAARHVQAREFEQAARLYDAVLRDDAGNVPALFERARLAVMMGAHQSALDLLARVRALQPDHLGALQGLAFIHQRTGAIAEAAACYARIHELQPADAAAAYNHAVMLQMLDRTAEAEGALRQALAVDPGFGEAANNLGNLLTRQERHEEAVTSYRQALRARPDLPGLHYNLGLALQKLGRRDEARALFDAALQHNPQDAEAMLALGTLAQDGRDPAAAADWYRRAATAAPHLLAAHFNLGTALRELQRYDEAITAFEQALRLARSPSAQAPDGILAGAYFGLADLYKAEARIDAWVAHYQAVPASLRDDVRHALFGFEIGMHFGDFAKAQHDLALLARDAERIPEIGPIQRLLGLLQYTDLPQADLLRFYRRYNELAMAITRGERVTPEPLPREGRRIRIGYLSPDFKVHVMGLLMYEVIARHDRARFEIFLYALNDAEDALTQRFREAADAYTVLDAPLSIDNARRIAQDKLDLLVDLGGHMAGARPLILAWKPAPVQITHLGYHGSLGLDTVDYKMTDAHADLPGNALYLVEDLLPMPGCLMPFLRRKPADGGRTRAELGIAQDAAVFGVFVNALKLGPRCLAAWRAILERVPNGVLAFSPHYNWARDATLRYMDAAGIARERIVFIPSGDEGDFGRWRYRLVDVVLDTFPYTGGDTTVAALDMGLPVVTLCGERQSERVTFSILKHLGVEEGIAYDDAAYIELAVRLAHQPDERAAHSAKILRRIDESHIADMAFYTRNLEAACERALA